MSIVELPADCQACVRQFYPPPDATDFPGDMRAELCDDCRPAALAARDQFYAQTADDARAYCAEHGHEIDQWCAFMGLQVSDLPPERRVCERCGARR